MISSGLIKKGEDGKFSAQEGHVALTYVFGKTVLDLVGEIGSAASTIKELIRANLKPGEDYVNLKTLLLSYGFTQSMSRKGVTLMTMPLWNLFIVP